MSLDALSPPAPPYSRPQAAYISGILWEVCAEMEVAEAVIKCSAVPALLHVCSKNLAAAVTKSEGEVGGLDGLHDGQDCVPRTPGPLTIWCMLVPEG